MSLGVYGCVIRSRCRSKQLKLMKYAAVSKDFSDIQLLTTENLKKVKNF